MRIVAVDWSGKLKRAGESLWLAEVRDGRLVDLYNGRSRDELVEDLVELAADGRPTVVGLDFAFSFPRWWCDQQGWSSGGEVWAAMAERGERLLDECMDPFWGRPGKRNPLPAEKLYRCTDRDPGTGAAKSVFQIGGAGAVGTGSIRGMPHLLTLANMGFGVWPFADGGGRRVVEIYPRALTDRKVNKSRWKERHDYLFEQFTEQPPELLERAAGSEDAFDAAASALVMGTNAAQLWDDTETADPDYAVEGRIWRPQ